MEGDARGRQGVGHWPNWLTGQATTAGWTSLFSLDHLRYVIVVHLAYFKVRLPFIRYLIEIIFVIGSYLFKLKNFLIAIESVTHTIDPPCTRVQYTRFNKLNFDICIFRSQSKIFLNQIHLFPSLFGKRKPLVHGRSSVFL